MDLSILPEGRQVRIVGLMENFSQSKISEIKESILKLK
jgi:hypothetical protein